MLCFVLLQGDIMNKTSINPDCITYSQWNMIFNARTYYRRLTAWIRTYLLSRYFGIGTAEDLFGQLYFETLDLGNMLLIIHGREDSEKYSQLLSQFVITLRDVITAQLEGNMEEVDRNVNRLYRIAAERKEFIQAINPYATPEYEDLFVTYIRLILEEANALASGDYSGEIGIYDLLTDHAERMGDAFALGIYNFLTSGAGEPGAPRPGDSGECITYEQMNAIYQIGMFWFELVTWVRNYMFSRYTGLGNAEEVKARLMQVPAERVDVMRQIFGEQVSDDYVQLFYTYIDLIDGFITAQIENNADEIGRITRLLYQNADERAAMITSLNPAFWDETEWRNRLYTNLRSTLDESTTFLTGDYGRNIDIFRTLLDQAESTGNYLTQGLLHYLTQRSFH